MSKNITFDKVTDDFNYPFPKKQDVMSNLTRSIMDVTRYESINVPDRSVRDTKFRSTSLFTGDIDGARTVLKPYKFTNKECFINRNDDILEPKKVQLSRESTFLKDNQLDGAKPLKNKFKTGRISNPIAPEYPIATYTVMEPIQPKFIKDPLEIDDIEGTRKKKDRWYNYERNVNPYTEIEGSKPRIPKIYKDKVCSLKIQDISTKPWKSGKNVNPLNPTYVFRTGDNKEVEQYGYIDGTENKPQIDMNIKERKFNLDTQDIKGAQADYVLNKSLLLKTRTQFREPTRTDDIPGAKVGTLKKQILTMRQTNPLRPNYVLPGHTETFEYYGNDFTKSVNEMKIHDKIQNSDQVPRIEKEIKMPFIQNNSQQNGNGVQNSNGQIRPSSNKSGSKRMSQRSQRSYTSNASVQKKGTVAQQLDSFISKY